MLWSRKSLKILRMPIPFVESTKFERSGYLEGKKGLMKDAIKLQFWKYVFLEFDPYKGFQDILASAALIITIISPNMMKLLEYPFCSKPQWVNTQ